jgi:TolB-like protein
VLPFENLSEEKANAYFADGIRREIVARLTKQHVKAASVQEAPHTGELLLGSVERAGNRVRVNVQLVDATSRIPHWAETYDRELTDVFGLQSEIAENVAKSVAAKKT